MTEKSVSKQALSSEAKTVRSVPMSRSGMIAIVRIRGMANVSEPIQRTMSLLRLRKVNQMAIVKEEKNTEKMVQKIKDYTTFGKISEETLAKLIAKRGRLEGNKKISFEYLKDKKIDSFETLAKEILEGKTSLKKFGIKEVFRLHPPRKGHKRKGIKKPFAVGGALGNRKEKINELIMKMI